jgi:hypothetical protein
MRRTDAWGDESTRLVTADPCPICGHTDEIKSRRLASLVGEAVDLQQRLAALEAKLGSQRPPELRAVPYNVSDAAGSRRVSRR